MTEQDVDPFATQIRPNTDSRLHQLLAELDTAQAAADAAAERLKAIKDGIKVELTNAAPEGATTISVDSPVVAKPVRLLWVVQWRLDTKRLKSEDPETYVRYAVKGGRWELRRS